MKNIHLLAIIFLFNCSFSVGQNDSTFLKVNFLYGSFTVQNRQNITKKPKVNILADFTVVMLPLKLIVLIMVSAQMLKLIFLLIEKICMVLLINSIQTECLLIQTRKNMPLFIFL